MVKKFLADHTVRLAVRALAVGAVTFAAQFVDQAGHVNYSSAGLHAAIVAGALAALEVFTPLNSLVGLFAKQTASVPASAPVV